MKLRYVSAFPLLMAFIVGKNVGNIHPAFLSIAMILSYFMLLQEADRIATKAARDQEVETLAKRIVSETNRGI